MPIQKHVLIYPPTLPSTFSSQVPTAPLQVHLPLSPAPSHQYYNTAPLAPLIAPQLMRPPPPPGGPPPAIAPVRQILIQFPILIISLHFMFLSL